MRITKPRISYLPDAVFFPAGLSFEVTSFIRKPQSAFGKVRLRRKPSESRYPIKFHKTLPLAVLAVFLFGCTYVKAQGGRPQAAPSPAPQSSGGGRGGTADVRATAAASAANAREVEDAFNDLRSLEIPRAEDDPNKPSIIQLTRNLYRKPNKTEMKVLAPSEDSLNKYAVFLHQSDSGVIKLNADSTCAENDTVVTAKETCVQYSMPGAGTAYSFRTATHRLSRLADLTLTKDIIKSDGLLEEGILVELGDVPLESLNLASRGLKYLVDFQPFTKAEDMEKYDSQLLHGIKADGFLYAIGFYVRNQRTYALRSIAYKGKVMRAIKGMPYNEMDFDKRRDVIVVFRVVEMESNGNITLAWKMLANKESPTLKLKQSKEDDKK